MCHLNAELLDEATKSTPPKIDMAMKNPPFEDVFPIENGDFPMLS